MKVVDAERAGLGWAGLGDDVGDALLRVLLPGHGRVLQWGVIAWRPRSGAHEAERKPLAAGDSPWGLQRGRALLGCHLSDHLPVTEDTSRAPEEPDAVAGSPLRGTPTTRSRRRTPQRGRRPRCAPGTPRRGRFGSSRGEGT